MAVEAAYYVTQEPPFPGIMQCTDCSTAWGRPAFWNVHSEIWDREAMLSLVMGTWTVSTVTPTIHSPIPLRAEANPPFQR